jgi:hypothetical protein
LDLTKKGKNGFRGGLGGGGGLADGGRLQICRFRSPCLPQARSEARIGDGVVYWEGSGGFHYLDPERDGNNDNHVLDCGRAA